jgi:beta-glucanase (GH16 family)
MKNARLMLLGLSVFLLGGIARAGDAAKPLPTNGWTLVWSDEFDKPGLPDSAKWTYEVGFIRNNELQYYTRARRENARVEDGCLVIEARMEKYTNAAYRAVSGDWRRGREFAEYTSASVNTHGLAAWKHARVEVRAKIPHGRGTWPAIWMLGEDRQVGWPSCGEIDIMEFVGHDPDTIHGTVHTGKYNHMRGTAKGAKYPIKAPYDDFHVYAVEWDAEKMDFYLDGNKYFTYKNDHSGEAAWPFDKPCYLILNTAIGGDWGGQQGVDKSIFPQKYWIDYVRVYQKNEAKK